MNEQGNKILIDVAVEASAALKELAKLRAESKELKQAQKELDLTTKQGAEEYERLAVELKNNAKAMSDQQRTITKSTQLQKMNVGSLDAMKTQIALATKSFDALSEAERKSAEGKKLQQFIRETSDALKAEKKAIGDTRLEVGNYEEAIKKALDKVGLVPKAIEESNMSLGEMRKALGALQNMSFGGLSNEDTEKVKKTIADLKAGIDDFREEIKGLDTGEFFSNTISSINAIVASVTAVSNAMKAIGVENEFTEKIIQSTTQLIATIQALSVVTEYLEKKKYKLLAANVANIASQAKESVSTALNTALLNAQAKAQSTNTATKIAGTVATKAITAAQKLWNAAMAANPVGLLIAGITALIGVVGGLIAIFRSSFAETDKATQAQERYAAAAEKSAKAVEAANAREYNATTKRKVALQDEILKLMQAGATDEEIAEARAKADEDLTKAKIEASKKREAENRKEFKSIDGNCVNKSVYTFSLHKKYSYLCISSEKGRF